MKNKNLFRLFSVLILVSSMLLQIFSFVGCEKEISPGSVTASEYRIVVGKDMTEIQDYAAKELRKYLYQLSGQDVEIVTGKEGMDLTNAFVVGTLETNSLVASVQGQLAGLAETGAKGHEGEQGYVLKKIGSTLYIAGTDDAGVLYGVYGLLDDHYGIGFYFSGDAIPEEKKALTMPEVDEAKTPRQYMRGILPWTNFPQSATVYSMEDWIFIIDQMARMRMNFLNIHNYNGQGGHNEMYHSFEYNGILPRNWNATASSGHVWSGPGWDVNEYRFGAADLFDDYDFGTDSTLHNEYLDNKSVAAKGTSMFQQVIDHAHSRGVKIGLGLDIDIVMSDYGVAANAEGLPEAQAKAVMEHYDNLDVLLLFTSEYPNLPLWKDCYDRIYKTVKEAGSSMQLAVSGWGVNSEIANYVADDVIVAPISYYESGMVDGVETYGEDKEYWGGPWMERDFNSSVYFYPYRMGLDLCSVNTSDSVTSPGTIPSYQANKDTMAGLFTLSWRLTDGVDAKMMYIAKAPWDLEEKYKTGRDVYEEYVRKCYGVGLPEETVQNLTDLVNEDEATVVPTLWSECLGTPSFTGADRSSDIKSLQSMIDRVDAAISMSSDSGCIARLGKLRDRLVCAQYYCKLDQSFGSTDWQHLQDDFRIWAQSFMTRVDDISSLGNVQSSQNRFVQLNYVARETELRSQQEIKAPLNVEVKATESGAMLTWEYEYGAANGFNVYRNDEKVNAEPLSGTVRNFFDTYNGEATYTVKAVVLKDAVLTEGVASIPQICKTGTSNDHAPQPIVVSPPTSARAGQNMSINVRILDDNVYEELQATLYYRALGSDAYTAKAMDRRVKATFTADIDSSPFEDTGIEYYVVVSDGKNSAVWPATGGEDKLNAVCTVAASADCTAPLTPANVQAENGKLTWSAAADDVFQYRIYRSDQPSFTPNSATFVTYVEAGTTSFKDVNRGFDGKQLSDKTYYYRVTAVDRNMNESIPSAAVKVDVTDLDPLSNTPFMLADEQKESGNTTQEGSSTGTVVGWTKVNGYAKFSGLNFGNGSYNAVEVTYAADGSSGGGMEIWIDGPSAAEGGTKLGEADLFHTGGWNIFKTVSILLEPAVTGKHDIYFVYGPTFGTSLYCYNLDYFKFIDMPESSETDLVFDTEDMMAYRASSASDMREEGSSITNFGNIGDRIVLGDGIRPVENGTVITDNVSVTDTLPGYTGVPYIGVGNTAGIGFTYLNVPAGKIYLAYDKYYAASESDNHKLSVYVGDSTVPIVIDLKESTGSDWSLNQFSILYKDTGAVVTETCDVKFTLEEQPSNAHWGLMNVCKLFVAQSYVAEQVVITYSNTSDMQCSLYLNGTFAQTITLPDSGGEETSLSIPVSIENACVEFRIEEEDFAANDNAKGTIYSMILKTKSE